MKSILVPLDFSPCSLNALEFAAAIAAQTGAEMTLLHCFQIAIDTTSPVLMPRVIDEITAEETKLAEAKMQNAIATLAGLRYAQDNHHLKINTLVKNNNLIDAIEELSNKGKCDFIVMGTKGATGLKEVFIGSNTVNVMEKVKIPLLAVPDEAKYRGFRHIVYATALEDREIEAIDSLKEFAELFDAELTCLHINKGKDTEKAQAKLDLLEETYRFTPISRLNFQLVEEKSAERGLLKFLNDYRSDLIAIMPKERDFVRSLFHSSLTKRLAFHSVVPVLVIK